MKRLALICLGLLGIPLIVSIWESLPTMKLYQMLCLIIVGVLYNISFWTYFISCLHTIKKEVGK